jgi:hypothetical protein
MPPLFNSGNAAEFGRKGQLARKAAAAQRATKAASIPLAAGTPADQGPADSLMRVSIHMQKLHELMGRAKDYREWDSLSRAFERLFKIWQVLSNTPGPGQRKPLAEPPRRREVPRIAPSLPWQPASPPLG